MGCRTTPRPGLGSTSKPTCRRYTAHSRTWAAPQHSRWSLPRAQNLVCDWHPDNDRSPHQVSIGAKYRALWRCRTTITFRGRRRTCGYVWTNTVANRARSNQGCPACKGKAATNWNCLAELHPNTASEWDPTNDLTPWDITPGSGYIAKWICRTCDHHWPTQVDKRIARGHGCPACSKRGQATTANNFEVFARAELLRDWHPKNLKTPADYRPQANVRVWWRCGNTISFHGQPALCGHEWEQTINRRFNGVGCPACSGNAVAYWNHLAITHPALVCEWHPDDDLRPEQVTRGMGVKVKWHCSRTVNKFGIAATCGYEWEASVNARTSGKGCRACAGHVITYWNHFAARYPEFLPQYAPENTRQADGITPGTDYIATWICDNQVTLDGKAVTCGHKWKTRPVNRIAGTGCPECMLWATSKDEIYLAHELAHFHTVYNTGKKIRGASGSRWKANIVIADLRITVEYDGSYWHRDKAERDLRKTADLEAAGWHVVRVREHPLDALSPYDVLCRSGQHKEAAVAALTRIDAITGTPTPGFPAYEAMPGLINNEAARQRAIELRANVLNNRLARKAKRAAKALLSAA